MTIQTPAKPRLARTEETQARYNVSRSTLRRWRMTPSFPKPHKIGSMVFYDLDAVDAWIAGGGDV